MTDSEKKKIEHALKFVEQNKNTIHKRVASHKWGSIKFSSDYYDKAAKNLGIDMYDAVIDFFNDAEDKDREILIAVLMRMYKLYNIDKIPSFFIEVILNNSLAINVRKSTARTLALCFAKISLQVIKQIYRIKEFKDDILQCLPFCENEERHEFAVEVLKEQLDPQTTETALNCIIAEKITPEDAELLKTIYTQSKKTQTRYFIIELLYKSSVNNLDDFFLTAYKKERLLPNRLQAIIGLHIKSDIKTAEKTIHEFIDSILKRKKMDEQTLGDLQNMVDWLKELKETYPSRGFHFAYETLSSMDVIRKRNGVLAKLAGIFFNI